MRRWALVMAAAVGLAGGMRGAERLVIKGSDTLGALLVPQLVAAYREQAPQVQVEIAAEGSSTGILAIIEGAADIGMSSRPLSESELSLAAERGLVLRSVAIAKDGMAVIVNADNPLRGISLRQIEGIFCGDVRQWSWLGWPEGGQVVVYTRHTASGTYARFQALAMRGRDYHRKTQKLAGNEQIAFEVAKNPQAIGYVSLLQKGHPGVRVLEIDGAAPTAAAIDGGGYGLTRTLYFVIRADVQNAQVRQFVEFVLGEAGQRIVRLSQFIPVEADHAGAH